MANRLYAAPLRRRRIAPQDGRALEMLGHAIEYLTDEYIHRSVALVERNPVVEAVRLLMERNREIYLSCPEIPAGHERFVAWLLYGQERLKVFHQNK